MNLELKGDENPKEMMASRKSDLKLHQQKAKPEPRLMLKLKLFVGEGLIVPVEDVVVDDHCLFKAGKEHHLNYLEDRNNHDKMGEVEHDPEVLLLDH